jgi:hypothetical protein
MVITDNLRREHIIPHKLGGQLILHNACCVPCQDFINKEIETPTLKRMWLVPRTHLNLPTSAKRSSLRLGRWKDSGETFPPDLTDLDFRFDDVPLDTHPLRIIFSKFLPPGILWNRALTDQFTITGIDAFVDQKATPPSDSPDERTADFQPFSPDLLCRSIAKMAHSGAIAELGVDAFAPMLPDIIMKRSSHISHLVGSQIGKGHRKQALHEILLTIKRGFVIASVQLFARFGLRPFHVVVGRASDRFIKWNSSALLTVSMPSS